MDWYQRLNEYFPEKEMKKHGQLRDLINEQDHYHKEESEDHLILYGEFPSFLFVDYLLVSPHSRGTGVGSRVIDELKKKKKPILLEVEPIDPKDPDTAKRIHFYEKHGFTQAEQVRYQRKTEDGDTFEMLIYYWTPNKITPKQVLKNMAKACDEIHNYRSMRHYGRIQAKPEDTLELKEPAIA
ncbi:GNAT family N-acetyltransferase [Paludifilum halophilum]|uniref:GNAT family N-acetyltransferase n=1 Tax=Paludifilum halophilum TaxID=1642702 RepID=A0A235B478_9BACL|nr:GNAT family N-acetyltransferase [Paludifilum halophilum]OYD07083.1 GNAT family N-acetyltransferase [Paludifilum halophilum]